MCQASAAAAEIDEGHAVFQAGPTQYFKFDNSKLEIRAADCQAHGFVDRLRPQQILYETFVFVDKMMLCHDRYPAMRAIIGTGPQKLAYLHMCGEGRDTGRQNACKKRASQYSSPVVTNGAPDGASYWLTEARLVRSVTAVVRIAGFPLSPPSCFATGVVGCGGRSWQ